MRNRTLTIAAALVLLTGWLVVPGLASAQALKTPIEGTGFNCSNTAEPQREWVDEDGIRHVRGQWARCRVGGDLRGVELFLQNWDDDQAGEMWFEHGTLS